MYIDGFLVPVPKGNKDAYRAMAEKHWPMFKEFGATRMVECWGDDVPKGKLTDFYGAVKAEPNETVVFSWIVFKSKADRNRVNKKVLKDPRLHGAGPDPMPFDGKRMIFGGFVPIVDVKA